MTGDAAAVTSTASRAETGAACAGIASSAAVIDAKAAEIRNLRDIRVLRLLVSKPCYERDACEARFSPQILQFISWAMYLL